MKQIKPVVLGVCGFKKSGKTTLIEQLLLELNRRPLRLAVIKHQNEPIVVIDQPGTDTHRFFNAGAAVLGWDNHSLFIHRRQSPPPTLDQLLSLLGDDFDLILIEGFKHSPHPKIFLLRPGETQPPPDVTTILAVLNPHDDRLSRSLALLHDHFGI